MEVVTTQLQNIRFVVKETEVEDLFGNIEKKTRVITICLEDKMTKINYPHPITDFIRLKYQYDGKPINTQAVPAQVVCRFLNFIYMKIIENDNDFIVLSYQGISGLKLLHGSRYISYLTKQGKKRATVKHYESFLKSFYLFLHEQSLISPELEVKRIKFENNTYIECPFDHPRFQTRYPSRVVEDVKHKLKDFGENRYLLVAEFIHKARGVAPDIALGICIQFFGGLRRGELLNLTIGSIKARNRQSMVAEIRDNREILFPH